MSVVDPLNGKRVFESQCCKFKAYAVLGVVLDGLLIVPFKRTIKDYGIPVVVELVKQRRSEKSDSYSLSPTWSEPFTNLVTAIHQLSHGDCPTW
jgi:hypothetical protein